MNASGVALPVLREPVLRWFDASEACDDDGLSIFSLLRWDYRLVETLYGRDVELQKIIAWAENGSKLNSARLMTGPGGVGKTRVAAEAAKILRAKGWSAGFLPRTQSAIELRDGQGLFLIVDYPEERPEQTEALLRELAEHKTTSFPLRILFLSRRSFFEWEQDASILQGRFGKHEIAAPAPLTLGDCMMLIDEAARHFASCTRKDLPDLQRARSWLNGSELNRLPLYAMAAAIHAVLAPSEAFGFTGGHLLKDLAVRERQRVRGVSEALGLGRSTIERFLALGVLSDGLGESEVKALATAGVCERSHPDVVGLLASSPWWKRGRLVRLEPDALAATFFDLVFFDSSFPNGRQELREWLFLALRDNTAAFGSRLARILYDLSHLDGRSTGLHPLDECLLQMLGACPERAACFENVVRGVVPFWAANFAARVAQNLARAAKKPEIRASYFNNAAGYLSLIGQPEQALAAAQEAERIFRSLATKLPDVFKPHLAMSLNTVANMLYSLGMNKEALTISLEAFDLYCVIIKERPNAFAPNLAMAFNTLAMILSDLGRRDEALTAAQKAVELYRSLVHENPGLFKPELAHSLNTLAGPLSALHQHEEALAAAQEAADLYRVLVEERPDAFMPSLVTSLNNVANRLAQLGRPEEALITMQKVADLRRTLADKNPDAFMPDLARSLNNLANMLSALGRHEEANSVAQEALDLFRTFAAERPEAFAPYLAMVQYNFASILSALGRSEEALAAAQEAVDLYRALAAENSQMFGFNLARSLNILANRLSELGRWEQGLAAAQEAVPMFRPFAADRPEAFTPDLAMSLNTLAIILCPLGRDEEALAAAQEATRLFRPFAAERPQQFTPDLVMSLNTLATTLSVRGQRDEALAVVQEAVDLCRSLVVERPKKFMPNLAVALNNLSNQLSDVGRRDDALVAAKEAVALCRPLAHERPAAFNSLLAKLLNNLGKRFSDLGRNEEALAATREAAKLPR